MFDIVMILFDYVSEISGRKASQLLHLRRDLQLTPAKFWWTFPCCPRRGSDTLTDIMPGNVPHVCSVCLRMPHYACLRGHLRGPCAAELRQISDLQRLQTFLYTKYFYQIPACAHAEEQALTHSHQNIELPMETETCGSDLLS